MKEQFKTEELAATATEIRDAVRSKSITADMVGGTLLALVNAVGEVVETLGEIPREHVTVRVKAYDGESTYIDTDSVVYLDIFSAKGYPAVAMPRQELAVNEDGVVEFDVPHGFQYAIFSKCPGLSASFQWVHTACVENRVEELWNVPTGVWWFGALFLRNEDTDVLRSVPMCLEHFPSDWDVVEEAGAQMCEEGEGLEDEYNYGILVATEDTCFVIPPSSLSENTMTWCDSRAYGHFVPTLPCICREDEDEPWEDVQNRARADMDGNMNTAKILGGLNGATAAEWCGAVVYEYSENRWLPSAGQVALMQINHRAINALMQEAIEEDWDYALLPYQNERGSWQHPSGDSCWWTSTQYDDYRSWVVCDDGYILYNRSYYSYHVRAVSAFHFEY